MPKHKKTLEQKKRADEQHVHTTPVYTYTSNQKHLLSQHSEDTSRSATAIVRHDLTRTAFISLSILAIQIIFFFLLKNHLLAINFVRY